MELICPSCEARYQVPDGSIGEKGRQVSCMNCGHGWHAFPPLVLGAPGQTPLTSPGWQGSEPAAPRVAEPVQPVAVAADEGPRIHGDMTRGWARQPAEGTSPTDSAGRENRSRSEQLAEIRELMAEVQSEQSPSEFRETGAAIDDTATHRSDSDANPEGTPREQAQALFDQTERAETASSGEERRANADPDETEADPLRQRLGRQAEQKVQAKPTDVRRLRRRHDKRERQRKHARAAGSGAFMTGFLLVAMVAAVMIALYMLSPQIVERVPSTENAMNQYVETIDGWRVSVAETYESVKGWVAEKMGWA